MVEAPVWNFAYGANMNLVTLRGRGIEPLQSFPARLQNWQMRFDMIGIPWLEPAFGNIEAKPGHVVHGVVHLMSFEHFQRLRNLEGGGGNPAQGYDVVDIKVETYDGKQIEAKAFSAVPAWRHLSLPSHRYLSELIQGAQDFSLDREYIQTILLDQKSYSPPWLTKKIMMLLLWPIFVPLRTIKDRCFLRGWSTLWFQRILFRLVKGLWWLHDLGGKSIPS